MDAKRVGRRIKAFRKLKGYTQIAFAEKVEIPIAVIGAVERGTKEADEELLKKITKFLEISKEELVLEKQTEEIQS
ncbi:helix-turn-helix domain-containing protein [Oceanobacillus manasiensis]|uniref:helix-turn-helix domain-containing protein n=1 Tax=Oceanobacillus manasiensis TaxID=586413 RepID=UPI0005AAB3A4|nr:helix-turn-helix transcriptional regulator [Oceanobacillus manasiensis]